MHILVISPVYPPYKGGMGVVAAQEARLMREAGHNVRIVTPHYSNKPKAADEFTELMYPLFSFGNAAILPWGELWQEIRKSDVVHLHYPFFGSALPVAFMARLAKKRLVVTWHMQARAERHAIIRRTLFFFHRLIEEPMVKRLAHAMCVSSKEYGDLRRIPREKMVIVPFGVDDRRFFPGKNVELRKEWGITGEVCVFLFVGGMDRAHAFKGVPVLLHAFAKVPPAPLSHLFLVGDGDLRGTYMDLAKSLELQGRVTFLGIVPFDELPNVYRAADAHVLPSVSDAEAYGLVTCEAGATGIPSIVSNLTGVCSLVDHEKTGLHVPPRNIPALTNALTRLAVNKGEREAWGKAACEKITHVATLTKEQGELLRAYTGRGNVHNI